MSAGRDAPAERQPPGILPAMSLINTLIGIRCSYAICANPFIVKPRPAA